MKHILLLFLITCAFVANANDTLTRAQVYNFNVGDTFDYKEHVIYQYVGPDGEKVYYKRCIIQSIYYSGGNDTLYVIRKWEYPLSLNYDTLVIDNPSYPVGTFSVPYHSCQIQQFSIDTSVSVFNNSLGNEIDDQCTDTIYNFRLSRLYCAGLGLAYSLVDTFPFEADDVYDTTYIIYHASGNTHWGTPYYIADNSSLIHYAAIPEECAAWVSTTCPGSNCNCLSCNKKVVTGNRISFMGHTYVELLYSGMNTDNSYTQDSLIGYFRNDTLNRKAYIYNSWQSVIDTFVYITYDFGVPAGGSVLSLSHVIVGGQSRTMWNADSVYYNNVGSAASYIEGVGSVGGIYPYWMTIDQAGTTFYFWSKLTCFSVCGQTLYPYDSTANCSLAGINNIAPATPAVKVYPTVNNGLFNVQVLDQNIRDAQLLLTDITGREIKRCALNNNELNNISIQQYAGGMYLWRVLSHDKLVQAGKLIKE